MLDFREFQARWVPSMEGICREIFRENRERIAVKKEAVGTRNLTRILDAVLALSKEKSFHAMTLRELARRSGLSMGALYAYFSGKEELRSMIQRQGVSYAKKVLREQVEAYESPAERLEAAMETHLYLSELLRSWFYFAYMEAGSLPPKERRQAMEDERATERIFRDILEAGVASGAFVCPDVELTAALIKAMLQDWYLKRWKYKRRGTTVEAYAGYVVGFVRRAIDARPPEP